MFGGNWGRGRLSIIGTVETSWGKATEPFEHETAGDVCAGLGFLLECWETEMDERRLTHEALLDDTWVPTSDSFAPCSLAVKPLITELGGRVFASLLVILLVIGRLWR